MDNPNHNWFKAKIHSWGWTPARWQGWLVLIVYTAALIGSSLTIDENSPSREIACAFLLPAALFTIALIRICYKTGEKPRWQWDHIKNKRKQNPSFASL